MDALEVRLDLDTRDFLSGLNKAKSESKAFDSILGGIGLGFGSAITQGAMKVAGSLFSVGQAALGAAAEAQESENLFEVSFGEMAAAARRWSQEIQKATGLNEYELRKNAGMLYTMTQSMGLTKQSAFEMSTGMTKLAGDMASFYNLPMDVAFNKLRSGLVGEMEPLRQLGILVDANTVKQTAYAMGIARVGEELTEQQKVQARYQAILSQTGKAQGDLARTMDSPVNQLRLLKEQTKNLQIAMGEALLPVMQLVLLQLSKLAKFLLDNKDAIRIGLTEGIRFALTFIVEFIARILEMRSTFAGAFAAINETGRDAARMLAKFAPTKGLKDHFTALGDSMSIAAVENRNLQKETDAQIKSMREGVIAFTSGMGAAKQYASAMAEAGVATSNATVQTKEQIKQAKEIAKLMDGLAQRDKIASLRAPFASVAKTISPEYLRQFDIEHLLGKAQSTLFKDGKGTALDSIAPIVKTLSTESQKYLDAITKKTFKWETLLQGVSLLAGAIGGKFGDVAQVIGNITQSFKGWEKMDPAARFGAIAGGVGQIGGLIGGTAGAGIQGAAGGAMAGFSIGGPIGAVVGGIGGLIGGIFGNKKKKKEEERKRKEAEAAEKKRREEEAEQRRVAGYDTAASGITKMITSLKPATEAGAMAQAGLFSSVFWATVKEKGLVAASSALGEAFKKLTEGASEAMLAYLAPIQQQMNLATSEAFAGATEGAVGLAQALKGMADMGVISITDLSNASIVATDQYNQALAAAQAQGLEGAAAQQAAIRAVGPAISEIIAQYQALGIPLDENLLKLKETAEANGMAFKEDPLVRAANAMERVAAALERAYGGAKGLADEIGRGANASHQYRVPSYGGGGGDYMGGEEVAAAEGYSGWVNKPTRFLAGESGPEFVSVTPRGETPPGANVSAAQPMVYSPVINITQESAVQTVEGQRAFGQYVTAAVERALDQNYRGFLTRFEELARKAK